MIHVRAFSAVLEAVVISVFELLLPYLLDQSQSALTGSHDPAITYM